MDVPVDSDPRDPIAPDKESCSLENTEPLNDPAATIEVHMDVDEDSSCVDITEPLTKASGDSPQDPIAAEEDSSRVSCGHAFWNM